MSLQTLLDTRNISKYRLSQISGISKTTIIDICSGKSSLENCTAKTVYRIALALDCTVEFLLESSIEKVNAVSHEECNTSTEAMNGTKKK